MPKQFFGPVDAYCPSTVIKIISEYFIDLYYTCAFLVCTDKRHEHYESDEQANEAKG